MLQLLNFKSSTLLEFYNLTSNRITRNSFKIKIKIKIKLKLKLFVIKIFLIISREFVFENRIEISLTTLIHSYKMGDRKRWEQGGILFAKRKIHKLNC